MSSPMSFDVDSMQYSRDLLLDWMDNEGASSPLPADFTSSSLLSSDLLPASSDGFLFAAPLSLLATASQWPGSSEAAPIDLLTTDATQPAVPPYAKQQEPTAHTAEPDVLLHAFATSSHSALTATQPQRITSHATNGSSAAHEEQSTQSRAKKRKISPSTLAKLSSDLSADALWEDIVSSSLLSSLVKRIVDLETLTVASRDAAVAVVDNMLTFTASALTPADAAQFSAAFLSRPRVRQAIKAAGGADTVQKLQGRQYEINWQQSAQDALPDAQDHMPRMPTILFHTVSTQLDSKLNKVSINRKVQVSAEFERTLSISQRDVTEMHNKMGSLALWALTMPRDDLTAAHRRYVQQGKSAESEASLLAAMKQLARDVRRLYMAMINCVAEGRVQFSMPVHVATKHGGPMRCQMTMRIVEQGGAIVSVSCCFAPLTNA